MNKQKLEEKRKALEDVALRTSNDITAITSKLEELKYSLQQSIGAIRMIDELLSDEGEVEAKQ